MGFICKDRFYISGSPLTSADNTYIHTYNVRGVLAAASPGNQHKATYIQDIQLLGWFDT